MKLNKHRSYIVSGLERSGTSMMMQILEAGGVPVAFDKKRKADNNNPKGYYELEGGKVITALRKGVFKFDKYRGKFIKITTYGLGWLPAGRNRKYTIIYMERNINEVLKSMEIMSGKKDKKRAKTKDAFTKMNLLRLDDLVNRLDIRHIVMNYNKILKNPKKELSKLSSFIDRELDIESMVNIVDNKLYRNKKC